MVAFSEVGEHIASIGFATDVVTVAFTTHPSFDVNEVLSQYVTLPRHTTAAEGGSGDTTGRSETCRLLEETCHFLEETYRLLEETCRLLEETCHLLEETCRLLEETCRHLEETCRYQDGWRQRGSRREGEEELLQSAR